MSIFRKLPLRTSGAQPASDHPFKINFISSGSGSSATWKRGISYNSKLYKSISYLDTQTITGLLTQTSPNADDSGWAKTAHNDIIWLEITFSAATWPTIISATIRSKTIDNNFDAGEIEHDGGTGSPKSYTQTKARIVLGTVTIENNSATANQIVNSNLRMALSAMSAKKNKDDNDPIVVAANYPYPI